jgi:hypothetical protein
MTAAQMVSVIVGMVLTLGGLVVLLDAGHIVGLAPFLAGVGLLMGAAQ